MPAPSTLGDALASLREVNSGDSLLEAITAERINAIITCLRKLAEGENITVPRGSKSAYPGGVALDFAGGGGASPALDFPFRVERVTVDGDPYARLHAGDLVPKYTVTTLPDAPKPHAIIEQDIPLTDPELDYDVWVQLAWQSSETDTLEGNDFTVNEYTPLVFAVESGTAVESGLHAYAEVGEDQVATTTIMPSEEDYARIHGKLYPLLKSPGSGAEPLSSLSGLAWRIATVRKDGTVLQRHFGDIVYDNFMPWGAPQAVKIIAST